jgi:hypothetical protein
MRRQRDYQGEADLENTKCAATARRIRWESVCHGGSLALLVWYLIVPPIKHGQLGLGQYLSKWTIAKRFDGATECQRELDAARKQPSLKPAWLPDDFTVDTREGKHRTSLAIFLAQCVASDDPRLTE